MSNVRSNPARHALPGVVVALAGLLGACGTPTLGRTPAAPTDLAGAWTLDRAASDDAERILAAALPKPRRPRAAQVDPPPPGAAAAYDGDRDRSVFPAREGGPRAFLREFVLPAEYVELQPGAEATFTIVQGMRRRTHELGTDSPPSVTDRYGSRVVRAGWEGRTLVVTSEGGRELRLTETFRAGPEPDTLAYRVELRAQGLKKIDIDALYRRASAPPPARTAPEGPPAPLR